MSEQAKQFWLSDKAGKVFEIANAEQLTIQPYVSKIIDELTPKNMLDYGCGDSFISRLINPKTEIGLFDININESSKALRHLGDRNAKIFKSEADIPVNYYECIVFSFVLICLDTKDEFRRILANFQRYRTKDGKLIIVTTHPCFRQCDFRPFYTEYTKGKPFNYFNEYEPFEVFIRDNENEAVHFTDFHWSLSTTINELITGGFTLEKIIELPDMTVDNIPANKTFPPFLILICK